MGLPWLRSSSRSSRRFLPWIRTALLTGVAGFATVAFWSTATQNYVDVVLRAILPEGVAPVFAWGNQRCVYQPLRAYENLEGAYLKDLKKVKRQGFCLARTLIVDDTPAKVRRNYGNAIYVRSFEGEEGDDELPRLLEYLRSFRAVPDVRVVEKRGWRNRG